MNDMNINNSINSFENAINIMLSDINLSEDESISSSDESYVYESNDIFLMEENIDIYEKKTIDKKNIRYFNNFKLKKEKFCSISQEKFKGIAVKLPCKHIFKREPIINYLLEYNNKCPICRGEIKIKDLKKVYYLKKKVLKSLIKKKNNDLKLLKKKKNCKKNKRKFCNF
jgi:hypothetical protein